MRDANRWRYKAKAYRVFGMAAADMDVRHALFVAAEIYSQGAERVARCGRLAGPSPFVAKAARGAGGAGREALAQMDGRDGVAAPAAGRRGASRSRPRCRDNRRCRSGSWGA